jgi:hypothetical protein
MAVAQVTPAEMAQILIALQLSCPISKFHLPAPEQPELLLLVAASLVPSAALSWVSSPATPTPAAVLWFWMQGMGEGPHLFPRP